jgi:hypothetical protein
MTRQAEGVLHGRPSGRAKCNGDCSGRLYPAIHVQLQTWRSRRIAASHSTSQRTPCSSLIKGYLIRPLASVCIYMYILSFLFPIVFPHPPRKQRRKDKRLRHSRPRVHTSNRANANMPLSYRPKNVNSDVVYEPPPAKCATTRTRRSKDMNKPS